MRCRAGGGLCWKSRGKNTALNLCAKFMKVNVYDKDGKIIEEIQLPEKIFGVKLNPDLLHQVVVSQSANRRRGIANAKTREEVRGGGRKPWRQKGTGRARHGSIRSPLWKGGGVTFGPTKERVFTKIIPKKIARKALFMALSSKVLDNSLIILDDLKLDRMKTKEMVNILKKLPCETRSLIIALPAPDRNVVVSSRNIPKVETMPAKDLNALDLLRFKYLLMPKESIKVIEDTFLK